MSLYIVHVTRAWTYLSESILHLPSSTGMFWHWLWSLPYCQPYDTPNMLTLSAFSSQRIKLPFRAIHIVQEPSHLVIRLVASFEQSRLCSPFYTGVAELYIPFVKLAIRRYKIHRNSHVSICVLLVPSQQSFQLEPSTFFFISLLDGHSLTGLLLVVCLPGSAPPYSLHSFARSTKHKTLHLSRFPDD